MKVIVSPLAEADIGRLIDLSAQNFGQGRHCDVPQNDQTLRVSLASRPYIGRYVPHRRTYRLPISRTPFVAYYRVNAKLGQVFVVTIRQGSQDRSDFE